MKNKYKKLTKWMPGRIHATSNGIFLIIDAKELANMSKSEKEKFIAEKTEQGFTVKIIGDQD